MPKSRSEHLKSCKKRALEVLDSGDIAGALQSMNSDLLKHPETENHNGIQLSMGLILLNKLETDAQMRKFINDY